jgi:hypothetical protein
MLTGRGFRELPDGYSTSMPEGTDQQRCPVCGTGVFTDVMYEDPKPGGPELRQAGDSYEVLLFSCGHEVKGGPLAAAEPDRMTVERRESEETTEPVEPEPGRPTDDTQEEER